jgi:hypothetical protein
MKAQRVLEYLTRLEGIFHWVLAKLALLIASAQAENL